MINLSRILENIVREAIEDFDNDDWREILEETISTETIKENSPYYIEDHREIENKLNEAISIVVDEIMEG